MTRQPALTSTPLAGPADAPLLVVLPSLGGTVADWRRAAVPLADRFRVLGIDLPGHGASAPTSRRFTIADLADTVAEVVAALGADSVSIAGTSFGGAVVQELALRADPGFSVVAVVCSAPRMGTPESWAERAAAVRRSGTGSLVGGLADRWFSPDFRAADPTEVERVLAAVATVDDESYALSCEALGAWDATERVAALEVPVLAVLGEDDPVVNSEVVRPLIASPMVRSVLLHGARHQATIERPEDVAAAILAT